MSELEDLLIDPKKHHHTKVIKGLARKGIGFFQSFMGYKPDDDLLDEEEDDLIPEDDELLDFGFGALHWEQFQTRRGSPASSSEIGGLWHSW